MVAAAAKTMVTEQIDGKGSSSGEVSEHTQHTGQGDERQVARAPWPEACSNDRLTYLMSWVFTKTLLSSSLAKDKMWENVNLQPEYSHFLHK